MFNIRNQKKSGLATLLILFFTLNSYSNILSWNDEILVYNSKINHYEHIIQDPKITNNSIISFFIPFKYQKRSLKIVSNKNFTLFLNNKLLISSKDSNEIVFSLEKILKPENEANFFTVFSNNYDTKYDVSIIQENNKSVIQSNFNNNHEPFAINRNIVYKNVFIASIILFVLLIVLLKLINPTTYSNLLSSRFFQISGGRVKEAYNLQFNTYNIFLLLFSIIGISIALVLHRFYKGNLAETKYYFQSLGHFNTSFGTLLEYFILVGTIIIARLLIQYIIGYLLGIFKLIKITINHFIQGLFVFVCLVTPVFIFIFSPFHNFPECSYQFSFILFVVSYILFSIYNIISTLSVMQFRKLFLISYLCIVDLVSALVTYKLIFKI